MFTENMRLSCKGIPEIIKFKSPHQEKNLILEQIGPGKFLHIFIHLECKLLAFSLGTWLMLGFKNLT